MSLIHNPSISEINIPTWLAQLQFMNDGTDGAYNPLVNESLDSTKIYRFSSVNIPNGVTITPTSRNIIILCKGDVNIDGLLSASAKGATGGGGQNLGTSGQGLPGTAGNGYAGVGGSGGACGYSNTNGKGGNTAITAPSGPSANGIGVTGTNAYLMSTLLDFNNFIGYYGSGGGSGSIYSAGQTAAGGIGGGCIFILCNNLLGTGAIRCDGTNGGNSFTSGESGGSGGGGGGFIYTISKNTPTITRSVNGGNGGNGYGANGKVGGVGGNGLIVLGRVS